MGKPIDIAWRKRCQEPKIHVGKALTAPQALLITMLVCGVIGLLLCLFWVLCGSEDSQPMSYGHDDVPNGRGGKLRDIELGGRRGGRAGAERIGHTSEHEEVPLQNNAEQE